MPAFKTKGTLFLLIVGLLGCCVVMQMVGIEASLWDSTHIEDNSVESSISDAGGLVADTVNINILSVVTFGAGPHSTPTRQMFLTSIFHPPDLS